MSKGDLEGFVVVQIHNGDVTDKVAVVGKALSLFDLKVLADVKRGNGFLAPVVFFIHHPDLFVAHHIGPVEQPNVLPVFGDGGGLVKHVVGDFLCMVAVGLVAFGIVTKGDGAIVFEQYGTYLVSAIAVLVSVIYRTDTEQSVPFQPD